jgi:hypothetical protein
MVRRTRSLVGSLAAISTCVGIASSGLAWQATAASTGPSFGAVPGYHVAVFAQGTAAYFNPDAIVALGTHVFVDYKNKTSSRGVGTVPSTIVEYNMNGSIVRKIAVINESDGLRYDSATGMLLALSNNDANPRLAVINPATGAVTVSYKLTSLHGGGYDDLIVQKGHIYLSGSSPKLTNGVNTHPSVAELTMTAHGTSVKPIQMGDGPAMDMISGQMTKMNIWDPEGMALAPNGDVVQASENGATLTFIHNIGTAKQAASVLPEADQVDDLFWMPQATGTMFVVSDSQNVIYKVTGAFKPGTVYVLAGHGAPVSGLVGTMDLTTGYITPVIVGLGGATGFAFSPTVL